MLKSDKIDGNYLSDIYYVRIKKYKKVLKSTKKYWKSLENGICKIFFESAKMCWKVLKIAKGALWMIAS